MRWRSGRRSSNIEDRRGRGGGLSLGRGRTIGMAGGGVGIVVLLLFALLGGGNNILSGLGGGGGGAPTNPQDDELADFVSVVLADTEDTWNALFRNMGREYEEPRLVLFTDAVSSACGQASSAVGPFYCPADHQVYLDLTFFHELGSRFGAPGDFAQAYVVAHEVGHHVQTILGISQRAQGGQQQGATSNSVRLELQADCLAGIWAHHADRSRQVIEPGDIEEALGAASAIGDDTLQRRGQGRVQPETFTHGTSAQRERWFRVGFETGRFESCDTFTAASL